MALLRHFTLTTLFLLFCLYNVHSTHSEEATPQVRRDYKDQLDSGLMPLYDMAEWYLGIVQLSYLYDLEESIGIEFSSFEQFWETWETNWEEWTVYLIGFVICACVGVVLIIGMAISGGVVACCRCCGNCGGKNPPKKQKQSSCVVIGCGISLLIVSIALILGIIGMFASNEVIKDRLKGQSGDMEDSNVLAELIMSIEDVEGYFDDTVQELNSTVLGGYQKAQKELFETLDDIPNDALMALDKETGVVGNLTELYEFTVNLEATQGHVNDSLTTYDELVVITMELGDAIPDVKTESSTLLESCFTQECNMTKEMLEDLEIESNISTTDLQTDLFALTAAITIALNEGIVDQANSSREELEQIRDEVNNELQDPIDDIKNQTVDIESEISDFVKEVDEEVSKLNFTSVIDALESVEDEFDLAGSVTYWFFLTLGVIMCIIVLCNLVGLGIGSFCPQPRKGGNSCDCSSATGADWLLAGLSFTFIFYWIFTMITMALFVGVGLGHTEVCRHLIHYDDPKSNEVLTIYDRMLTTSLYNNTGVDLEPLGLYQECVNDTSFYNALDLDSRGYNISEIIDLSPVEDAVNEIKKVQINIPTIEIINQTFKDVLIALDVGLNMLKFGEYYNELMKPVLTQNITKIADALDEIAQTENITDLYEQAQKMRNLTVTHVEPAEDLQEELSDELMVIEQDININLTDIALNLDAAESTINDDGDEIIGVFVNTTADDIYEDVVNLADSLESSVRNDVGNCESLYDAITFAIDATCVKTFYPLHAFWYSLGWIIFFLFPGIIFSFKLVTEYRVLDDFDTAYDAFESPVTQEQWSVNGHPSAMLLKEMDNPSSNGKAPDTDSGVGEFDNPLYMSTDGTEFKIPRPSMVSASSDTTSADFKIPRPQISGNNSVNSSYYNSLDRESGSNPAGEDTQL